MMGLVQMQVARAQRPHEESVCREMVEAQCGMRTCHAFAIPACMSQADLHARNAYARVSHLSRSRSRSNLECSSYPSLDAELGPAAPWSAAQMEGTEEDLPEELPLSSGSPALALVDAGGGVAEEDETPDELPLTWDEARAPTAGTEDMESDLPSELPLDDGPSMPPLASGSQFLSEESAPVVERRLCAGAGRPDPLLRAALEEARSLALQLEERAEQDHRRVGHTTELALAPSARMTSGWLPGHWSQRCH